MSTFPNSPRVLKGGIVLLDSVSGAIVRTIVLQYNPDTLTRSFQIQATGGEAADRSEALRLKGPAVESFKLEAEIDAADQLEFPDQNRGVVQSGLQPQLAVLETMVHPPTSRLVANNGLARSGVLEITPIESPLTLFVWSRDRIVPVRVTEFSITEEAFDPSLNPIRAKVSLGMRVLNVNDLGFDHRGGNLFLTYQQRKEQLAASTLPGSLGALGITGIP